NQGAKSRITTLNNQTSGTITTLNNGTGAVITTLLNEGTITTQTNQGTTTTLTNNGTLVTLTNSGSINDLTNNANASLGSATNANSGLTNTGRITTFTNAGTITALRNNTNGNITTLTNANTITTLSNAASINEFNNTGSVTSFANTATATIATLNNTGSINNAQGINNAGTITTLNNNANGNFAAAFTNSGTINTLNNNGGSFASSLTNTNTIGNLTNAGSINGALTNANNATITTLDNSGSITQGITNAGTITTLTNQNSGTLQILTNANTITTLTNNGTITQGISNTTATSRINTLNNTAALSSIANAGSITTLNNTTQNASITTLTNNANATINDLNNNAGSSIATLTNNTNAQIQTLTNSGILTNLDNQRAGTIANLRNTGAGSSIQSLSNTGTITTLENTQNASINDLNNTQNAILTTLTNAAAITTLGNSGQIDTLSNTGNIVTLNNNAPTAQGGNGGSINTLNNAGSITTLSNMGTLTTLENSATIGTLANTRSITTLTNQNNASITSLNNSTAGNIDTLTNNGTLSTLDNEGSLTNLTNNATLNTLTNQSNATLTTLSNAGTLNALTNANNATLTSLNNTGTLTTLTNNGTLNTLTNTMLISTYTNNSANQTTTYTTNNDANARIISLTNTAGTIEVTDELYIGRNKNKVGTLGKLDNQDKINAQNNTISIYGELSNANSASISVGTLILTRAQSQAQIMPTTDGAHFNGNIHNESLNNTPTTITNKTNLTLTNWVSHLNQSAQSFNDSANNFGLPKDNTQLSSNTSSAGHIILGLNVHLDTLETGQRFDDTGAIIDNEAGILIIATSDKWGAKYNYTAMFLKNDGAGNLSTALSSVKGYNNQVVDKTNQYGEPTTDKAENLGGSVELKIEATKALYTPQSTIEIIDLNDGFSLGLQPKGSPVETVSQSMLNGIISKNILVGNFLDSLSRRIFHHSLDHREGGAYTITSKSINEEGKRVKDNNDIEVTLSHTNIDLLAETDMIYAPHALESNTQAFILPFTRYTTTKLDATLTGRESTFGVILGSFLNLKKWGIWGFYAGYESGNATLPRTSGSADLKHNTMLAGSHYYKTFYTKGMGEYYFKIFTHIQHQNPDLELKLDTIMASAKQKLLSYGLDSQAKIGANFYNIFNNSYLSPEIGLGYGLLYLNSFNLDYNSENALEEHYPAHFFSYPYVNATLKYFKALNRNGRYSFLLGATYNLKSKHTTSVQIDSYSGSSAFYIPQFSAVGGANFLYTIGKNTELSIQYDGQFSIDQQSHMLSLRYAIWF
ncbi:beta strand repeat-containing protein, partial [Helicobacter marmotae]